MFHNLNHLSNEMTKQVVHQSQLVVMETTQCYHGSLLMDLRSEFLCHNFGCNAIEYRQTSNHSNYLIIVTRRLGFYSGVGGTSPNIRYRGPVYDEKWTQLDLRFCKNKGSKRSKNNEKGDNQITILKENEYQILQNGQMADFGEMLDQLQFKLSMELYVLETTHFLQKKWANKIELMYKISRDSMQSENVNNRINQAVFLQHLQVQECPPLHSPGDVMLH